MPIDRLGIKQVINRQCSLEAGVQGLFELIQCGEIPNAVSVATIATGQQRPAGQQQAADVTFMLDLADTEQVARAEAWKAQTDVGAESSIVRGGAFQYFNQDNSLGPLVATEEIFLHTLTYPSTDVSGTGDQALLTCVASVFGARRVPGTGI